LLKRSNSTALTRGSTDWQKIISDQPIRQCYNEILVNAITDSPMPYEAFDDAIKKAGEETALHADSKCNYWFQFNADELTPATKGTRPTSACSPLPR
jgi:hypothetical protein